MGVVFSMIALVIGIFALAIWQDNYSCHSQWDRSGMPVDWGLMSGCQVFNKGSWIPAKNFRTF